jgi:DNA invertase Pin-like site-specific DNA recombinase
MPPIVGPVGADRAAVLQQLDRSIVLLYNRPREDQMTSELSKIVAYKRTSTDDQRLGIEAQDEKLRTIARERNGRIVKTFVEHESGGDNTRPELDRAIRHARRIKAVVVVAKLDRLARDSTFLMRLYDGNVPIIFGDLPEVDGSAASRLMIQMMANIAEFERRRIGERTKEALAVLKAKGVKLGTPKNLDQAGRINGARKAAKLRTAKAIDEMADIAELAANMRAGGASLTTIAAALNADGGVTRQGGNWSPTQVKRVLDRAVGKVPCRRRQN